MEKKETFGEKLRQERQGAENTLRESQPGSSSGASPPKDKKKAAQRRQIRREAKDASARRSKLKTEQEKKHGNGTAASAAGKPVKSERLQRPNKPGNVVSDTVSAKIHQGIHSADEDNNAGAEAAHFGEASAEGAARTASHLNYGRKLKQYKKASRLEQEAEAAGEAFSGRRESQTGSNFFSRWKQKQAIKKEYAAAKAGGTAANSAKTGAAKAAKETASVTEKAFLFVKSHSHVILIVAAAALLVLVISGMVSSCSVLINGGGNVVLGTSYTAEDEDILGADEDYTALEEALRAEIDNIESTHSGYDEYRYNLAEIGHNPYELASLLTVEFEDYTRAEVQSELQRIFDAQYELTLEEEVEIRTRTETRTSTSTDPETGETTTEEYEVEVEYEYYILNVTLTNSGIDAVARSSGLTSDQTERYEVLLETRGNRDDLFGDVLFAVPEGGGATGEYTDYDIPGEALTDERFRKMITEAEKYLGYPYVWGGSSPSTSFDCSGFVSWVINNCGNGWSVGRLTANGLMGVCDIIPKSEAQPGDLIFFQGTYNTSGASHVGIYVGGGMMIHCGNPISYASIETSYWQSHYYCMGRIR